MLEEIFQNIIEGNAEGVQEGVQRALDQGAAPDVILNQALIADYPSLPLQEKIRALFPTLLIRA